MTRIVKRKNTAGRIRTIAKRNNIEVDALRGMTFSQISSLQHVGKKTAELICREFSIPTVRTQKEVIVSGDQLLLFHREKGKKIK